MKLTELSHSLPSLGDCISIVDNLERGGAYYEIHGNMTAGYTVFVEKYDATSDIKDFLDNRKKLSDIFLH